MQLSLSLTSEEGAHTLFTGQREREGGKEREREIEREREKEKEGRRERKRDGEIGRENCYFNFLKGMVGALASFSYLRT
jgi:hypothetical protein